MFRCPSPFKRHAEIHLLYKNGEKYRFAKALPPRGLYRPHEYWAPFHPICLFPQRFLDHKSLKPRALRWALTA